jgi:hypothetical protein
MKLLSRRLQNPARYRILFAPSNQRRPLLVFAVIYSRNKLLGCGVATKNFERYTND